MEFVTTPAKGEVCPFICKGHSRVLPLSTPHPLYEMQKASDALCREYGLSVIENPQRGKSRQYGEWKAEQEGRPTWRGLIRAEMDEVIRQSMTERQFFDNLRKRGYEVKVGYYEILGYGIPAY